MTSERALIDTRTAIWLYQRQRRKIGDVALAVIEAGAHRLTIPIYVYLELQYLYEIGHIKAPADAMAQELKGAFGFQLNDRVTALELVEAAIPLDWTRDLFDRLIAAEAEQSNGLLLTKDRQLAQHYDHCIWESPSASKGTTDDFMQSRDQPDPRDREDF